MVKITVLLEEIKGGNRQSLEILKSRYSPLMNKLVTSFEETGSGTYDDLSYIAENALIKAAFSYDSEKKVTFGSYAKVCITNALRSAYRAACAERRRKEKLPKVKPKTKIISIPAFDGLTEDEIKEKINSVLSNYEKLILEKYLEGLKPAQIGRLVGKDAKSVSNAIFRIRRKICNIK